MTVAPPRRTRAPLAVALLPLLASLVPVPAAAAPPAPPAAPVAGVREGPVTVLHAEGDAGYARAVAALALADHGRVGRALGLEREVEVAILLLTPNSPELTREAWAERLPRWIAGAAIPAERFVVVRVPPGRTPRGLAPVLAHELTHVLLDAGYPRSDGWPLWFREGLAMRQERGEGLRDYVALSAAALLGRMLPFERLAVRFPSTEAEARLAYAQSASFLAFLDERYGRWRAEALMRRLRGRGFEEAFRAAYGVGPGAAEGQWLRWATRRYAWIPALTSGTTLWLLMTLLFLLAIGVRRRRSRLMRERWEAEEREEGGGA